MGAAETVAVVGGSLLTLAAVIKVVVLPLVRFTKRFGGRVTGALDNLGGRGPFIDHATGKTVPGIPAIGERLGTIEAKLDGLANTNTRLDQVDQRLTAHEERLNGLDTAVGLITGDKWERGAEAAIAAAQLKQQLDDDVIDVNPEENS